MPKAELTIACLAGSAESGAQVALLVRSLREFGGAMAATPVWVFVPKAADRLPETLRRDLAANGAIERAISVRPEVRDFPFASKVHVAAAAEAALAATGGSAQRQQLLVWMDPDTLILREPAELLMGRDETLGFRPVHHQLIGSTYEEPLDEFWALVYESCRVPNGAVFPMTTCAEGRVIRPYFNAGLLAVRPSVGTLRLWRDTFEAHYMRTEYENLYERDEAYAIFVHQALLSGVILANVDRAATRELPEWYNYPVHLHAAYAADRRPAELSDVTTCRYEALPFEADSWSAIPYGEPLEAWLQSQRRFLDSVPMG